MEDDRPTAAAGAGAGEADTLAVPEQAGATAPSPEPLTAESVGRYVFRGEIGRGGLGRVWVAHDTHTGRDVAIKELLGGGSRLASGATTDDGRRFLREARVTGQLEHPSIVPVYEIGARADGKLYYAMRRVQGIPLSKAIARGASLAERLALVPRFRDLCQAIAYAHSRGVIHRDIKPDNVMLGEFGETVVLDWGLAKLTGPEDDHRSELADGLARLRALDGARTLEGTAMGTPFYMPPEQARGELDEVDERSDIYALGAVLYEILTGRTPFDGRNAMEVVTHVLTRPLVPVREICPDAPPELAAVAEKALRKAKAERYASATTLANDVEAFMSGQRVGAYQYGSLELLRLFARRHRAAFVAAVVVLTALVAAVVVVSTYYAREHRVRLAERSARSDADTAKSRLEKALATESAERRLAAFHAASARMEKASAMVAARRFPEAGVLAAAALADNPAHDKSALFVPTFAAEHPPARGLRARAASVLNLVRALPSLTLKDSVRLESSWEPLALTPRAGGLFAAGNREGTLRSTQLGTHEKREIRAHASAIAAADFAPDATRLASAGADGWLRLWDAASGEKLGETRAESVKLLAFSPDGKRLASARADGVVTLRTPELRSEREVKLAGPAFALSWSPDSQHLAVVGTDKSIVLVDVGRGTQRKLPTPALGWHAAEYSPDGKTLATADWGKSITLWRADGTTPEELPPSHDGPVYSFGFSTDGRYLLSGGFDRRLVIWDLAARQALVALTAHDERIRRIVRLPEGNRFASMSWDRSVKLWELVPRAPLVGKGHQEAIRALALAPNGRELASGAGDKTIRLWDAGSLAPLRVLEGHSDAVLALAYSPDGKRLASAGADRSVLLWDAALGRILLRLTKHQAGVTAVAFLDGGQGLASADADGSVHLWKTEGGELVRTLRVHTGACWGLASSSDGRRFATVGKDKTTHVFAAGGEELSRFGDHDDWVSGVAFSPDGRLLATSGKDALGLLRGLDTGAVQQKLVGHDAWVNRVAFSEDGSVVVTSSDDQSLRLWSASSGEPLLVFEATTGAEAVVMSDERVSFGDGVLVRSVPYDVSVLAADPRQLLDAAEREAGLTLEGMTLVPHRGP